MSCEGRQIRLSLQALFFRDCCVQKYTITIITLSNENHGQDAHSILTVIVFSPLKVKATVPSEAMTAFCTSMFQS